MKNNESDKNIYNKNATISIGSIIVCPECHTRFIKKTYNQKFCCTACKDKYHNRVNP